MSTVEPSGAMKFLTRVEDIPADGFRFAYKDGPFEDEGFLLRLSDDTVIAFKNECRHLPMRLDDREPRDIWDRTRRYIVCSSHGARYRPDDGRCVAGPCEGSHLKRVPIQVRNGEVYLDEEKLGAFFK